MEGEGTPFRMGFLLPPNLPHLPRTSPMSPPLRKRRFVSFLESGGDMGEVLGLVWEVGIFCRVRLSRTFGRRIARNDTRVVPFWLKDNFYEECRFIPPHQSLSRQLPPEGKPSFRCANIANKISGSNRITNINRRPNSCISFLLYKTERNFEKASPWVGRKLQAVCRDSD